MIEMPVHSMRAKPTLADSGDTSPTSASCIRVNPLCVGSAASTPSQPGAGGETGGQQQERGRFWHGGHVDIRSNGAGEERGGEQERRTLGYYGRSRRKGQQGGIEVGHESARHKPRRSAAQGGIAEGEGKDVADALRSGRRTLLERDRSGRRRETPWCEPSAREAV